MTTARDGHLLEKNDQTVSLPRNISDDQEKEDFNPTASLPGSISDEDQDYFNSTYKCKDYDDDVDDDEVMMMKSRYFSVEINKVALPSQDNKRIIYENKVNTLAYVHYS